VTQFAFQVDLVVFWLITASLANPNGEAGAAGSRGDDAPEKRYQKAFPKINALSMTS